MPKLAMSASPAPETNYYQDFVTELQWQLIITSAANEFKTSIMYALSSYATELQTNYRYANSTHTDAKNLQIY